MTNAVHYAHFVLESVKIMLFKNSLGIHLLIIFKIWLLAQCSRGKDIRTCQAAAVAYFRKQMSPLKLLAA
eukprot:3594513-Amphidinium_carterae.1